jgi:glycosyltransferase involved in cell wall biosynthesis
MRESPFFVPQRRKLSPESEIVFVADLFLESYAGGAEMTSQAIIDASPFVVECLLSKDVTVELLEQGKDKYWIFGNFTAMDSNLIPTIVANMNYSILEYDYKYCKYRSPEKHQFSEIQPCLCHEEMSGKMISAFYFGAKSLWWMSEGQQDLYEKLFPFLQEKESTVLSSVFDDDFFAQLKLLRKKYENAERKGWIVLGSNSWIKGAQEAEQWCKDNKEEYEVLWGLPYSEVLDKLASSKGFVYLPQGMDTCPRMVIEAKLLGCELHLNDYVQHKNELWFDTGDDFDTEAYLYAARERFWSSIKQTMEWQPTISGYTTTRNCLEQNYPYEQSIRSMLGFADQVVVVDGGSTDGTWEALEAWAAEEDRLHVYKVPRDWSHPRHAVFDGAQKAEARKRCTSEYMWQMDCDEVVHEDDNQKIIDLCKNFPVHADLVSLPVIEYWGGPQKVRVDVNPWKWRLSRNRGYITHGIPIELRLYDSEGELYSALGTDGCDYVHTETGARIPHASFYTAEVDSVRLAAMSGNTEALESYQEWFGNLIEMLPGVHHYSWFDLARKIKTYKNYWQRHWESLYDISQEDTADNNMFFGKPWHEVSERDIDELAKTLSEKMGGWVFHTRVDFEKPTPHLQLDRSQPALMRDDD